MPRAINKPHPPGWSKNFKSNKGPSDRTLAKTKRALLVYYGRGVEKWKSIFNVCNIIYFFFYLDYSDQVFIIYNSSDAETCNFFF